MKNGLIIGKGWVGSRLENLLSEEFSITTTKRNSDANNCLSIDFDNEVNPIDTNPYDFIVITVPFGKRNSIEELCLRFENIVHFLSNYTGQLFLISSTGIYPNCSTLIDEESFTDEQLNEPYISIENLIKNHFPQLNILRLSGIMGDNRYLSKYLSLDRENLDEVVNHIHFEDILNIIKTCIDQEVRSMTYNAVAPLHPTKREVLEYQLNKKIISSTNREGKIISSQKIQDEFNYQFIYPNPVYFKEN